MLSPNPGGRPKAAHDVQELARRHTGAAIETLAKIMNDEKAPHSARLSAAETLLSRGWGRPMQPTVQADSGGKTFEQWLDELNGPAREALDEALAEQDADLAQRKPDEAA